MNAIKETPTNFRVYYSSMRETYLQKHKEGTALHNNLLKRRDTLRFDIESDYDSKKENYIINLNKYEEFKSNKYINGDLLRASRGLIVNRDKDPEVLAMQSTLYQYAYVLKDIEIIANKLIEYEKLLGLSIVEYTNILKLYYNKVHEKMICEGAGYAFNGRIGWICINRCILKNVKPKLDYKATKENKAKLLQEGKRIYNKEEATWCAQNGIEYNAIDARVYQELDHVYEVPLIHCTLNNGDKQKLTITNYVGRSLRGKSKEELLKEADYKKENICKLDLDLKAKLDLCLEIDKLLYIKFIRNDDQKPCIDAKASRKSR